MKKIILFVIVTCIFSVFLCSCTVLRKPLDNKYEFSKHLKKIENDIKKEDWTSAENNLKEAQKAWHKIKPFLQLDIDHDHINDIEGNFDILKAYIETKQKTDALASIYTVQNDWESIDSM